MFTEKSLLADIKKAQAEQGQPLRACCPKVLNNLLRTDGHHPV